VSTGRGRSFRHAGLDTAPENFASRIKHSRALRNDKLALKSGRSCDTGSGYGDGRHVQSPVLEYDNAAAKDVNREELNQILLIFRTQWTPKNQL
jgi:hypothetical protein